MKTVCFVYDAWDDKYTLEVFSKMTPRRSGEFRGIKGVSDRSKADFFVVIDDTNSNLPQDRTIYIGAHPYIPGYSNYRAIQGKGIASLDCRYTFGFGEWWLKYDYDYLAALKKPEKTKDLICILSNASGRDDHRQRKEYTAAYCAKYPLDLYGSIVPFTGPMKSCYKGRLGNGNANDYWFGKEGVLEQYRYALEFDMGPCEHYFSERIFDDILLWTTPIVVIGGTNIGDYLPSGSFHYADIKNGGSDVCALTSQPQDDKALEEARDLLLNKYQLWARIDEVLTGVERCQK